LNNNKYARAYNITNRLMSKPVRNYIYVLDGIQTDK